MTSGSSHSLQTSALPVLLGDLIFYSDPQRSVILTSLLHLFKTSLKFPSVQRTITLLLRTPPNPFHSLNYFPLLITYFNSASPAFFFHPVRHFSHSSFTALPPFLKWYSFSYHLWQPVLSAIDIMAPSHPEIWFSSCSSSHAAEACVRKRSDFAGFLHFASILPFLIFVLFLSEPPRLILLLSALVTTTYPSYLPPCTCFSVQTLINI